MESISSLMILKYVESRKDVEIDYLDDGISYNWKKYLALGNDKITYNLFVTDENAVKIFLTISFIKRNKEGQCYLHNKYVRNYCEFMKEMDKAERSILEQHR